MGVREREQRLLQLAAHQGTASCHRPGEEGPGSAAWGPHRDAGGAKTRGLGVMQAETKHMGAHVKRERNVELRALKDQ